MRRIGIAVAFVVVAGCSGQATASPSPPGPTPTDYGAPPAGVPLLYAHDPRNASWLSGFDWSGKPRATVKLLQPYPDIGMAPDGQLFLLGQGGKGGSGAFLDRLGKAMPSQGPVAGFVGGVWADDNRHRCDVAQDQQGLTSTLVVEGPGDAPRTVGVLARDTAVGQTGVSIAACSVKDDVAFAVRTAIAWPSESGTIRLSDGRALSHSSYARTSLTNLVVSRDVAYVAENAQAGSEAEPASTVIRRTSNGAVVGTLDRALQVLGFSGDDQLVLVTSNGMAGFDRSQLQVVDWLTRRVVWQYGGPETLFTFLAQPQAMDFALGLASPTRLTPSPCGDPPHPPCQQIEDPLRDVLIVHGDGSTTAIPGRYQLTW